MPNYLYHYTTEEGAEAIQKSGYIEVSRVNNRDAMMGEGVYLTDLPPSTDSEVLVTNNYNHSSANLKRKTKCCIRIPKHQLQGCIKYDRDQARSVYLYPRRIYLNQVECKIIEKEEDGSWGSNWATWTLVGVGILGLAALVLGAVFSGSDQEKEEEEKKSRQRSRYNYSQ